MRRLVLGAIVGGAVGYGLGRARPEPAPPSPRPVAARCPEPIPAAPPADDCDCADVLAATGAVAPIPWPAWGDPDAERVELLDALSDCAEPADVLVDCGEYPCVAWRVEQEDDPGCPSLDALERDWGVARAMSVFATADGRRVRGAWMQAAGEDVDGLQVRKAVRTEEARAHFDDP